MNKLASEEEEAVQRNDMKELHQKTRMLASRANSYLNKPVKDKEGNTILAQRSKWINGKRKFSMGYK